MLSDYQSLVPQLVRDDAGKIATTDRDLAITAMTRRYSKDRPRTKVEDVAATAANELPLPTAWEADFSDVIGLEYPIGQVPPANLEQGRWAYYRKPSSIVIMLEDAIAVGGSVRVTYTASHLLDASNDTIPLADREPAACWAAALLCDQLAAFYSGSRDSSIQADSVNTQSRAQEYASRAKTLRKRYTDELGVDDKRSEPAGTVVALPADSSWGRPGLLRPRRLPPTY